MNNNQIISKKDNRMYDNLNLDWKNIPTISDLKNDMQEANNSYQQQLTKIERWLSLLNPPKLKVSNNRTNIEPRLIRKQVEWRCPSLEEPFLSTKDLFTINPVTHEDVASAKQNELILNKQFRTDINKVKFISKYIRTAVTTGTVILKVGWEKEEAIVRQQVQEEVLVQDPIQIQEYLQAQLQQGMIDEQTAQQILMSGQPIPVLQETIKNVKKTIKDCPTIEIKDARNCYIDPACDGDFDKAKYIIDKFNTDIATLKKDGRFVNLDMINVEVESDTPDNIHLTENNDDYTANYNDRARKKLEVYEYWGYWDIEGNDTLELIRVFWVQDIIIRAERNPYPDKKMPYILVKYLDNIPNSLYGEAEASLLEDNQKIIGLLSRGMIDILARSATGQRVYKKDALDPINEKRMKSGEDFAINPHVNNLNEAFYQFTYTDIPASVFNMYQLQNNEAEALSGKKAFSQGITGQALGSTATAVRGALDSVSIRELSILRRLNDGLIQLAKKIISMNSVFLPDEIVIRITDDEDVVIKRDDLAGDYDLEIEISTAESDNLKAQNLSFLLQTLGNSVPFDITKMFMIELADLYKLPHLVKQLEQYQPQPDPLDQEIKMLQIEMLKAQIANEHAKAQENAVDVQLKGWKAKLTEAQVRATHSNADKLDLDYLEQATGLNQERELEKIKMKEDLKPKNMLTNKTI